MPDGPGTMVGLSDGTTASTSGETSVSSAANKDEGAATGSTNDEGDALALAGPSLALGLAGMFGGGLGGLGGAGATPDA